MDNFEGLTRKVINNIKKYSLIEFYHEENDLQKRIKQLNDSLEQFNVYLPNTCIVLQDPKKAVNDIKVDLRERLNGYIQKVDHSFGLKNFQYIIDNIKDERVKDVYRTLGPFDHFDNKSKDEDVGTSRIMRMDFDTRKSGAIYRG